MLKLFCIFGLMGLVWVLKIFFEGVRARSCLFFGLCFCFCLGVEFCLCFFSVMFYVGLGAL